MDNTGPAFSRPSSKTPKGDYICGSPGMTYRQWLIGMALQGLLASGRGCPNDFAEDAIRCADAVLEAEGKK